jgi:predicted Zn-dependent peptidase
VVTVELHPHTGMIAAYVRAGSRHEDPARNAVSHFLEHPFFRGARVIEGRLMNALVEDCGDAERHPGDHGYFSPVHPERLGAHRGPGRHAARRCS